MYVAVYVSAVHPALRYIWSQLRMTSLFASPLFTQEEQQMEEDPELKLTLRQTEAPLLQTVSSVNTYTHVIHWHLISAEMSNKTSSCTRLCSSSGGFYVWALSQSTLLRWCTQVSPVRANQDVYSNINSLQAGRRLRSETAAQWSFFFSLRTILCKQKSFFFCFLTVC